MVAVKARGGRMDVVLGVAVTDRVARLAMIASPADGGAVLDQYELDLPDSATTDLAETIVDTYRAVAGSGHRLAATRLTFPEPSQADALRRVLLNAQMPDVEVLSEDEAARTLVLAADAGAALLVDDDTVTLTVLNADTLTTSVLATADIGAAGAVVASAWVLQQLGGTDTPVRVLLAGQRDDLESVAAGIHERSSIPVEVPTDVRFAIARGAALSASPVGSDPSAPPTLWRPVYPSGPATQLAPAAGEATALAPAVTPSAADDVTGLGSVLGPQLAYSTAEDDDEPWPIEPEAELFEDRDATIYTEALDPVRPRMVLVGSAIAFLAVSIGALGVTVAINIRPTAAVSQQVTPAIKSDTVAGRFLPQIPHTPDPVAMPIAVLTPPPAARINNSPVNRDVPAQAPAPAPAPPPANLPAPPPAVPLPPIGIPAIPLPPIIVIPNNPFPQWTPPTTPPTTTPTTTTTSPTPTTTTTTPPTTTTTPPPTTTTPPPTTTTAPPTTSEALQTPTVEPTVEPAPVPVPEPDPVPAPEPAPVQTQAPAATEAPAASEPVIEAPATTVAPSE